MTQDPFDGLADHFMTGPDGSDAGESHLRTPRGSPHSPGGGRSDRPATAGGAEPWAARLRVGSRAAVRRMAPISIVVCGNLPVQGSLWVLQFADRAARTIGPVGLIRQTGDSVRGEVFRAGGRAVPAGTGWIDKVGSFVQRWLVAVAEGTAPEEMVAAASSFEVLTGADEAAIAAAKLKLRALIDAARVAGRDDPQIRITILGAPEPQASEALTKLIRWAEADLHATMVAGASITRMDQFQSAAVTDLFELESQTLGKILERLASESEEAAEPIRLPESPTRVPEATLRVPKSPSRDIPSIERPLSPRHSSPAEEPQDSVARVASASCARRSAADLFDGMVALPFRAPQAPEVELARDREGGLHLLSGDATLRSLRLARTWLETQRMLVASASGVALNASVTEHLALDDARVAVDLHGTGVLLHLVLDLRVDGLVIRKRIDLNDRGSARIPPE